jgi:hypothetical protein
MLQLPKVVAVCDHLAILRHTERQDEVIRKSATVSLDLFIQPLRANTLDIGQFGVDDDPFASNQEDSLFNRPDLYNLIAILHLHSSLQGGTSE